MNDNQLVVLTGPPGAGKSTVAAQLVDKVELGVHLHGDDFWHCIMRGWIPPYLDGSHHQNHVVISALSAAAASYAAGGYFTVVDTVIGPWFLRPVVTEATRLGVDLHYVVLRPSAGVAMNRALARAGTELREPGAISKMYEAFVGLGPFERHVIDSSAQAPEVVAHEVIGRVKTGRALLDPSLLPGWS